MKKKNKKNNKEEFCTEIDKHNSLKKRIKRFLLLRVATHISAIIAAVCGLIPISFIGLALTIFLTITDFVIASLIYQKKKTLLILTPIFIVVGVVSLCGALGFSGALDTLKLFAGIGSIVAAIFFFLIVEFFGWISYLCVRFVNEEIDFKPKVSVERFNSFDFIDFIDALIEVIFFH